MVGEAGGEELTSAIVVEVAVVVVGGVARRVEFLYLVDREA